MTLQAVITSLISLFCHFYHYADSSGLCVCGENEREREREQTIFQNCPDRLATPPPPAAAAAVCPALTIAAAAAAHRGRGSFCSYCNITCASENRHIRTRTYEYLN